MTIILLSFAMCAPLSNCIFLREFASRLRQKRSSSQQGQASDEFGQRLDQLLRLFIDLTVQEYQSEQGPGEKPKFVLCHLDLDIQNVIVSTMDGSLLSLIDWDGVIAVPQCILDDESYPSWLTRDWDAMTYRYDEDAASDGTDLYENSPSERASYREKYQEIIDGLSESHSARKMTHNSPALHNLKIVADDLVWPDSIVERIFEEVKAKTSDTQSIAKYGRKSN
ncbi:hypothetical protein BJX76DRAFT_362827 [Aspergillus varians]